MRLGTGYDEKGQSNWSIASLCSELVVKMAKDIARDDNP